MGNPFLTVANYRSFFKVFQKMMPEIQEQCSCSETCCPSSKKSDDDIKNLLRVCYSEWVIMGILATMIMLKMETYLDDEEWVGYMIYSTMLFVFSLPFIVGFHSHTVPRCNCDEIEKESSNPSPPKPNSKSFGLIQKVESAFGFGASREAIDDESTEESEASSSSSIVKKVKRKSQSKKRSSKTKSKKKSKSIKKNVEKGIKNKSASALTRDTSDESSSEEST